MTANALSHLYSPEEKAEEAETFILPELVVQWTLDDRIAEATAIESAPLGCPINCTYIPVSQRISFIESIQFSVDTAHSGSNQTLSLLQFWWTQMARDIRSFIQGSGMEEQLKDFRWCSTRRSYI